MATKAKENLKETPKADPMKTIEAMAQKAGINKSVLAGVKVNEGWTAGKEVTTEQFDAAVKRFLDSPLDSKGGK